MPDIRIKDISPSLTTPRPGDVLEVDNPTQGSAQLPIGALGGFRSGFRANVSYVNKSGSKASIGSSLSHSLNIGSTPLTVGPFFFLVPLTFSGNVYPWWISDSSSSEPFLSSGGSIYIQVNAAGGISLRHSRIGVGSRFFHYSGFSSDYAGQILGVICSIPLGGADPCFWFWTAVMGWRDVSTKFTLTSATLPVWIDSDLAPQYKVWGNGLGSDIFIPGPLTTSVWGQPDVDFLARYGILPPHLETIYSPTIGWTAQLMDKVSGLHMSLPAGVSPVPSVEDTTQILTGSISATGYVLGFSGPHVFRDYTISKVEVRPTTATIPNITLRRNATSGGTTIVSPTSAGNTGEWAQLPITGGTEDGQAGDYFHLTLSQSADCDYRLTLTRR